MFRREEAAEVTCVVPDLEERLTMSGSLTQSQEAVSPLTKAQDREIKVSLKYI